MAGDPGVNLGKHLFIHYKSHSVIIV